MRTLNLESTLLDLGWGRCGIRAKRRMQPILDANGLSGADSVPR
jgi:hypothetical protein